ncbi:hypothetical protein BU23DRAFT_533987 [Bimuria novae-zelandiae CBS 107.79]|uniref:Alpha/beta-hydrolase n=1 Tax=Bimuria novae-zelandiae CBS 107.79 TaxID=1447943 RepID=A0A6A5V8U3_9PLEO|nr:hypothetical protein BU23DRAFT_533987 [Bimuria novae-zelandiae CBS 107.79]
MPSEPRWSCTIPSIHDDTPLSVRIYHPSALHSPDSPSGKPWRKRGIVMAHPYAPMGGSYDDRVVGIVTQEFLSAGWIVGTFNFRGAHGPKGKDAGRTSWTGKPELADFQSVAGLFMHYMSYLRPDPASDAPFTTDQSPLSSISAAQLELEEAITAPLVVLAGYSYGSLILRHLPPIPSILNPFAAPITGSAAAEIILKAHKLVDQVNLEFINAARDRERSRAQKGGHSPEHKLGPIAMGGEETSPEKRRSSRDIRRSLDTSRTRELGNRWRSLSHAGKGRRARGDAEPTLADTTAERSAVQVQVQVPDVKYLLISPLTPPTSRLVAPGLARGFWNRAIEEDATIKKHETLAVFGDQDMFASARKMREWAEKIGTDNPRGFVAEEIKGAGHFWVEDGVERQLREALQAWEKRVRGSPSTLSSYQC